MYEVVLTYAQRMDIDQWPEEREVRELLANPLNEWPEDTGWDDKVSITIKVHPDLITSPYIESLLYQMDKHSSCAFADE